MPEQRRGLSSLSDHASSDNATGEVVPFAHPDQPEPENHAWPEDLLPRKLVNQVDTQGVSTAMAMEDVGVDGETAAEALAHLSAQCAPLTDLQKQNLKLFGLKPDEAAEIGCSGLPGGSPGEIGRDWLRCVEMATLAAVDLGFKQAARSRVLVANTYKRNGKEAAVWAFHGSIGGATLIPVLGITGERIGVYADGVEIQPASVNFAFSPGWADVEGSTVRVVIGHPALAYAGYLHDGTPTVALLERQAVAALLRRLQPLGVAKAMISSPIKGMSSDDMRVIHHLVEACEAFGVESALEIWKSGSRSVRTAVAEPDPERIYVKEGRQSVESLLAKLADRAGYLYKPGAFHGHILLAMQDKTPATLFDHLETIHRGEMTIPAVLQHVAEPPHPYVLDERKIYKETEARGEGLAPDRQEVCARYIFPVAVRREIGSDIQYIEIRYYHERDGWMTLVAKRDDLVSGTRLLRLASRGLPVHDANKTKVAHFISDMLTESERFMPRHYASSNLGIHFDPQTGEPLYLHGDSLVITAEGIARQKDDDALVRFVPTSKMAQAIGRSFKTGGTLDGYRQEVLQRLGCLPDGTPNAKARAALYGAMAAPFITLGVEDGFTVDVSGGNGTGKTTAAMAITAAWGSVHSGEQGGCGLVTDWASSTSGLTIRASMFAGITFYVDDTNKAEEKGFANIGSVTYLFGGNITETKATKDRELQDPKTASSVLLSTGETPITNLMIKNAGGARERVMCITNPFGLKGSIEGIAKYVGEIKTGARTHYGHLGPLLILRLLRDIKAAGGIEPWRTAFHERYVTLQCRFSDRAKGVKEAGRIGGYAALATIAAGYLHDLTDVNGDPVMPFEAIRDEHGEVDVFPSGLWEEVLSHNEDSSGEYKALQEIMDYAVRNEHRFWGRAPVVKEVYSGDGQGDLSLSQDANVELIGHWAPGPATDGIGFLGESLNRALTQLGYNPAQIIRKWDEKGYLAKEKSGGKLVNPRRDIRGSRQRVVLIKASAFQEAGCWTSDKDFGEDLVG